jgi:serine/threonine protein kinase
MPGQAELTEMREQFQFGLDSFVEEANRLTRFNELPGTVDIYDSFAENGTGYIVMEYLESRTVKLLAGTAFSGTRKGIALQILATLKEVHRAGIIHRDIASDNIFVLPDGGVRRSTSARRGLPVFSNGVKAEVIGKGEPSSFIIRTRHNMLVVCDPFGRVYKSGTVHFDGSPSYRGKYTNAVICPKCKKKF